MPLKILTVDDSITVRTIIRKILSDFTCEFLEAEDGVEGLAKAKKENPDLIILDIDMPQLNGFQVLRSLRSDNELAQTPVFMLTSQNTAKSVRLALELGISAYLGKPFKRMDLIERIQKVLPLQPRS